MSIYEYIVEKKQSGRHMLAVLLDPESPIPFAQGELDPADFVFVGGSTGAVSPLFIEQIRAITTRPVILFPGNLSQFTPLADALLYLSVLSSRNADLLVGQQIASARAVRESGIEVLSMGYILIDGGKETSVVRESHSAPIPQTDVARVVDTALAGEMMGKKLIYLEAGSGAKTPVSIDIIRAVRQVLTVPLIVGGGITSPQAMRDAFAAGADIVVIGNHFEQHPDSLPDFVNMSLPRKS